MPPLTIFGTTENDFCWGLVDTSLAFVLFPAIITEGTLSVVAAADMPEGKDGIK
jgi:hypothetical protein